MANYKAKKAGFALADQKKLDARYDVIESQGTPGRVMEWMNATLGADHPACPCAEWRKMQNWMRDGIVLCKFINKIREAAGMAPVKFGGNAHIPVVAMGNIDTFNKGAVEYGLAATDVFPSGDLYDAHKGTFFNVIVLLNKLGAEANRKGFTPKYQYVEPPMANDVH